MERVNNPTIGLVRIKTNPFELDRTMHAEWASSLRREKPQITHTKSLQRKEKSLAYR